MALTNPPHRGRRRWTCAVSRGIYEWREVLFAKTNSNLRQTCCDIAYTISPPLFQYPGTNRRVNERTKENFQKFFRGQPYSIFIFPFRVVSRRNFSSLFERNCRVTMRGCVCRAPRPSTISARLISFDANYN